MKINQNVGDYLANSLELYHKICGKNVKTTDIDNTIILLNAMAKLKNNIKLSQFFIDEWNLFNEIDEERNKKKQQIIDKQMRELNEMNLNNNKLREEIEDLNFNLNSKKIDYDNILSKMNNIINETKEQNKQLEKAYNTTAEKYNKEIERSNDSIKNLTKEIEDLRKKEKELNESKKEEMDYTETEIENLNQQLKKMKDELNEIEKNKEYQKKEAIEKKKELENLKQKLRVTMDKLNNLNINEKKNENLEEEIKKLKEVMIDLKNQNSSLSQEILNFKKKELEIAKKDSGETKENSTKKTNIFDNALEKIGDLDSVCFEKIVIGCSKELSERGSNDQKYYRSNVDNTSLKLILDMLLKAIKDKKTKTIKQSIIDWLNKWNNDFEKMKKMRAYFYIILDEIIKNCKKNINEVEIVKDINYVKIVKEIFSNIKNNIDETNNLLNNDKKKLPNTVNKLK